MNEPLRIAIFASVSSPQQATVDKDSLPSQLRDGRLWTDSVGGDVVATFEIPGHSRKCIFFQDAAREIPAYAQLRQACEQSAFDVLWCRARDRLGRTDALIAQVEALVTNAGARVYSATMPTAIEETSEASAIFLSAIERAQAQVENVIKTKRHRTEMSARVLGTRAASGWPHGYRPVRDGSNKVIGGEFVPSEIEAVRLITKLYLKGHGMPYITKALDDSPWRPRQSKRWSVPTVTHILTNSFYAGYPHFGDVVATERSTKYPAVWDPPTYAAIRREQKRRARGGRQPTSPFSGVVFCTACGARMSSYHRLHADGRDAQHFRCNTHNRKAVTGIACHYNGIPEEHLTDALLKIIAGVKTDPAQILERQTGQQDLSALERAAEEARELVEAVKRKRHRLGLALADGVMSTEVYRSTDAVLVDQLEAAAARLATARTALLATPTREEREAMLEDLIARFDEDPGWLHSEPPRVISTHLKRYGLQIWCKDGKVVDVILCA